MLMMILGTFYYAGGIYYILRQWLTEPINKTPQEVAVLMCHFLNEDTRRCSFASFSNFIIVG